MPIDPPHRTWLKPINFDLRDAEYLRLLIEGDIQRLKDAGEAKLLKQAYRMRQLLLNVIPPKAKVAHSVALRRRKRVQ